MSIIKLWKEKGNIFEGVKNSIFKQDHIEEIAKLRMDICERCPLIDTEGSKCYIPGTQPCCSDCGCKLSFKTRSLSSSCPKNHWSAITTQEEEDAILKSIYESHQKDANI
jgi:hypothetical protein